MAVANPRPPGKPEALPGVGCSDFDRLHCRRLSSELTDRRALTCQSSKTPRRRSQAQTAVRCSDLVRRHALYTQKISGQIFRYSPCGPASLRPGTITADNAEYTKRNPRIPRGPRSKKSLRRLNVKFSPPNCGRRRTTQAQRPGPRGRSVATRTRWPGSLQRMAHGH